MPRRSAAEAERTREAIVERARDLASVEGLEGVTIGRLADEVGMSKAGVIGQFGSKVELQRAALRAAGDVFAREIVDPANGMRPGLARVLTICDAWVTYVTRPAFPGGCFFTAASIEFDGRPGIVRDEIRAAIKRWRAFLRREVAAAIEAGDIDANVDPEQASFELYAVIMGLNQEVQLFADRRAAGRARHAMRRILGAA